MATYQVTITLSFDNVKECSKRHLELADAIADSLDSIRIGFDADRIIAAESFVIKTKPQRVTQEA